MQIIQNIIEFLRKNWKVGTIGFLSLIGAIFFFIALIVLISGSYFFHGLYLNEINRNKVNLPEPLSTRGLPPPVTDVPVTLPPDPGEEGKKTLAGIDSNNDGVRDDLEREIVYMYPQNEEVRRVLRAMVKKEQEMITDNSGEHEYLKGVQIKNLEFYDCYDFLVSNKFTSIYLLNEAHSKHESITGMLFNTPDRYKAYRKNADRALPYSAEVGSIIACEKVQGQY